MQTISESPHLLMTNILRFSLLFLILLVSGCASTKYSQDYREGTDFSQLTTYSWRNISSEIPGVDGQQVQYLVDRQLAAQGYALGNTEADLLLDMTLVTRVSTGSSTGLGLSIGLPIGRMGSVGLGGGKSIPNDKQEGVILIDITNSQTNSLIWRGSAEGVPMKDFSLRTEDKLAVVLGKLLSQFPPK